MPVYEYHCQQCGRQFSRFFWKISDAEDSACRCGSTQLEQLVSRVNMVRSEETRMESLADPSQWGDLDENDPKSMARMMKKLGSEMGEDLGPEFNEVVDRLEAGEDPESLDRAMGETETSDSTPGNPADYDNLF